MSEPDSQVTVPSIQILMYLYEKVMPAGRLMVAVHRGTTVLYELGSSRTPLAVFQLPSWAMEPTM